MSETTDSYTLSPAESIRPGDDLTKQAVNFDYGKLRWSLIPWDSVRAILIWNSELGNKRPTIGRWVWIGPDHLMRVFGILQHGDVPYDGCPMKRRSTIPSITVIKRSKTPATLWEIQGTAKITTIKLAGPITQRKGWLDHRVDNDIQLETTD
jgi:hypothetical protein